MKQIVLTHKKLNQHSDNGIWKGETEQDRKDLWTILKKHELLVIMGSNINEIEENRSKCMNHGFMLLKG